MEPNVTSFGARFVAAVLLTEIVTEIITSSAVFEKFRSWLRKEPPAPKAGEEPSDELKNHKPPLIGVLFSCGYCFSVWMGVLWALVFRLHGDFDFLGKFEYLVWGLIVHRTANLWHAMASDGRSIVRAVIGRVAGLMK